MHVASIVPEKQFGKKWKIEQILPGPENFYTVSAFSEGLTAIVKNCFLEGGTDH